jgi:hypothetical protein
MKGNTIYLLFKGNRLDSGNVYCAFRFKKDAVKFIKECKNKYTYNKKDDLYECYEKGLWFRIDRFEFRG